jgi:hypothetical protein
MFYGSASAGLYYTPFTTPRHLNIMPSTYISYIRDTFTLLLNTSLAESNSSNLPPPTFIMTNLSLEGHRGSLLDSVRLLTLRYPT